jgi:WhiB family redox-sensing transcriptional regulator
VSSERTSGPSQAWRDSAGCRDSDPGLFFGDGDPTHKRARAICAACPVSDACLAYALAIPELVGIWAGTTEAERQRIRTQRAERAARLAWLRAGYAMSHPRAGAPVDPASRHRVGPMAQGVCPNGHVVSCRTEAGRVTWQGPCPQCRAQVQARRLPQYG